MWLFFDGGFVSIVANIRNDNELLVRARDRADLQAFLKLGGSVMATRVIDVTPERDYRYRVSLARPFVAQVIARAAASVDYSNFKERAHERHGHERAHIYGRIWSDALAIDTEAGRTPP